MNGRNWEFVIWRWATVVALVASAYLIARSERYVQTQACGMTVCLVLDRWTGEVGGRFPEALPAGNSPVADSLLRLRNAVPVR